jgi:hypothetical protein
MTAYVQRGDKVIVYAGNLNMGAYEEFLGALQDQGVEVIAKLLPGAAPTGRPEIVAVIETPERCDMCGYDPEIAGAGMTLDGTVVVDEATNLDLGMRAVRDAMDCEFPGSHAPHPWYCTADGLTYYCKGIPS